MNDFRSPEDWDRAATAATALAQNAESAANFLKALSHEGRLMILCHIAAGEKSVGALEEALGARQSAVSQNLSRLREDGLVQARRDGKQVHYSIKDPKALRIMALVHEMFCGPTKP